MYALVLRILAPLTSEDEAKLVAFADAHGVEFWLQTGGPHTVVPFHPPASTLAYTLPEFDVAHAVRADRFHAGESVRSIASWCAARWRC